MTAPRSPRKPSLPRAAIEDTSAIQGPAVKRQILLEAHAGYALSPQDLLLLASEELDNIETSRMAIDNQRRALVTPKVVGKKGGHFGKGLPQDHPVPALMLGVTEAMAKLERDAVKKLEKAMRGHPFFPWVKRTIGVGAKQAGRLLAVIGDPGARATVSQLWAYCGYHVVEGRAPRRSRGQRANWNPTAKMRAFLIAESCMKQMRSPLRKVYDDGRAKYEEAIHVHACPRCGPEGKPAPVGSTLSDGHKHARALRLVAKEILKQLWIEARSFQKEPEDHERAELPSHDPLSEESAAILSPMPTQHPRRASPISSPTDAIGSPKPTLGAHTSDLSKERAAKSSSTTNLSSRRSPPSSAETILAPPPIMAASRPPSKTAARPARSRTAPSPESPAAPRSLSKTVARRATLCPPPNSEAPGGPPSPSNAGAPGAR